MTDQPKTPENVDEVVLSIQMEQIILAKDREAQVGTRKTHYADLVQVNDVVLKRLNAWQTTWVCRPHVQDGAFGLHYSLNHLPSGTSLVGVWPLKLSENPQQMGSAVTYGRRYALLALLGIVAEGEDDDGTAASGQATVQRRPVARPAPRTVGEATDRPTVARKPSGPPLPGEAGLITSGQLKAVNTLLTRLGIEGDGARHAKVSEIINEPVDSLTKLTETEAGTVITKLGEKVNAKGQ